MIGWVTTTLRARRDKAMTAARSVVGCGRLCGLFGSLLMVRHGKFGQGARTCRVPLRRSRRCVTFRDFGDRLAPVTATSALFMSGGRRSAALLQRPQRISLLRVLDPRADLRSTRSISHQCWVSAGRVRTPNRATPVDARPVARSSSSSPNISTVAAMTLEAFPVGQR